MNTLSSLISALLGWLPFELGIFATAAVALFFIVLIARLIALILDMIPFL